MVKSLIGHFRQSYRSRFLYVCRFFCSWSGSWLTKLFTLNDSVRTIFESVDKSESEISCKPKNSKYIINLQIANESHQWATRTHRIVADVNVFVHTKPNYIHRKISIKIVNVISLIVWAHQNTWSLLMFMFIAQNCSMISKRQCSRLNVEINGRCIFGESIWYNASENPSRFARGRCSKWKSINWRLYWCFHLKWYDNGQRKSTNSLLYFILFFLRRHAAFNK